MLWDGYLKIPKLPSRYHNSTNTSTVVKQPPPSFLAPHPAATPLKSLLTEILDLRRRLLRSCPKHYVAQRSRRFKTAADATRRTLHPRGHRVYCAYDECLTGCAS